MHRELEIHSNAIPESQAGGAQMKMALGPSTSFLTTQYTSHRSFH
jgi:hypothetical protein